MEGVRDVSQDGFESRRTSEKGSQPELRLRGRVGKEDESSQSRYRVLSLLEHVCKSHLGPDGATLETFLGTSVLEELTEETRARSSSAFETRKIGEEPENVLVGHA